MVPLFQRRVPFFARKDTYFVHPFFVTGGFLRSAIAKPRPRVPLCTLHNRVSGMLCVYIVWLHLNRAVAIVYTHPFLVSWSSRSPYLLEVACCCASEGVLRFSCVRKDSVRDFFFFFLPPSPHSCFFLSHTRITS